MSKDDLKTKFDCFKLYLTLKQDIIHKNEIYVPFEIRFILTKYSLLTIYIIKFAHFFKKQCWDVLNNVYLDLFRRTILTVAFNVRCSNTVVQI